MANDAYGSLPSFSFTGPQAENLARGWDYAISDGQRYAITPLADHGRPNMGQRAIDWLPPDPTAVVPNTFPPPMQERLPIYGFPLGTSGMDAVCTPGFDLEQPGIDDLYRLGPDLGVDPGLVPWVLMAEYIPPDLTSDQRIIYRKAVHIYKQSRGLPPNYNVPQDILDQMAQDIKIGADANTAADKADDPPEGRQNIKRPQRRDPDDDDDENILDPNYWNRRNRR
jgi:hypothetical protein